MQVMLKDGRMVKMGRKRPAQIHWFKDRIVTVNEDGTAHQTLRLGAFYDPGNDMVPPPASVDWSIKAMASISRMYGNDQWGDCVIAGKYHQAGIWSGNDTGTAVLGTDAEVLASYHTICGAGDPGCNITDVLDYFRDHGLLFSGVLHKIDGYVAMDWTNRNLVQVAIDLFGSVTLGINLPNAWTCTKCTWDTTTSAIVGGHDVCAVGYNSVGVQICTWAGIVTITWAAFLSKKWIEECYVELGPDWYNSDNLAPNGINVAALKAALAQIGGGSTPPIPDPGPPNPPNPPTPVPQTITINVPQQPVIGPTGRTIGHVPAYVLTGTLHATKSPCGCK